MLRRLIVILVLLPTTIALAQDDRVPENPYGIVEGFWFPELTCDLNPGWERIIFDWAQHQPNGPTDWHTLNVDDRWLKAANQCDREVVALLKNTPAWATRSIPGAGVPTGLYLSVDDPQNHWANFVRQAAAYYAPRGVHRFIIWNEPDISRETFGFEFDGSLEDYARMVKVASIAARQGNPAAQIHLAGTTYWHNINEGERLYLDALLEALTLDPNSAENDHYFDAISLHIYFRTDTVYELVMEARRLLDSYGLTDKVIWINETNAPPTQDPDWPVDRPVFKYTLEQQAAFLVQAGALAPAAGVERVAVYKLFDQALPPGGESFGILVPGTEAPRPAFDAWRTVTQTMTNRVAATRYTSERVDMVVLEHATAENTAVVWSRVGEPIEVSVDGIGLMRWDALMPDNGLQAMENGVVTLAAAICNGDDPAIPCPVGGMPLVVRGGPDMTIQEIGSDGTMMDIPVFTP